MKTKKETRMNDAYALQRGLKRAEVDHMPYAVATANLLSGRPMSSRERREYQRARATYWTAIEEPDPKRAKLAGRMAGASWEQITRWLRRAVVRRSFVTLQFAKLPGQMPVGSPLYSVPAERRRATLNTAAADLDDTIYACQFAILFTKDRIAAVQKSKKPRTENNPA